MKKRFTWKGKFPRQKYFDYIFELLAKQGKSVDDSGDCQYRGARGKVFAAGPLIPDDLYDPSMEGCPVGLLSQLKLTKENLGFIGKLQECHDEAYGGEQFLDNMTQVAQDYKLKTGILSKVKIKKNWTK